MPGLLEDPALAGAADQARGYGQGLLADLLLPLYDSIEQAGRKKRGIGPGQLSKDQIAWDEMMAKWRASKQQIPAPMFPTINGNFVPNPTPYQSPMDAKGGWWGGVRG